MYSGKEADKIRLKKQELVKKYIELLNKKNNNNLSASHKDIIDLTNRCFGHIAFDKKDGHIMYCAFLGIDISSMNGKYVFDEDDEYAENALKSEIKKLEK